LCWRHQLNSVGEPVPPSPPCWNRFWNMTIRPESRYANGFNRTVLTTENIAVFVAMPSARAAIAAIVKLGVCRNMRTECCRYFRKVSIRYLSEKYHEQFRESTRRARAMGKESVG